MKRMKWGMAALAMSLALTGCVQGQKTESESVRVESSEESGEASEAAMAYQRISAEEAKRIMDTEQGYIIVDVRTPGEFAQGHVPNAINIPNETIADAQPEALPDKAQRILIYCRSGNRSRQAADKLVAMGYTQILDFGGISGWPYDIVK